MAHDAVTRKTLDDIQQGAAIVDFDQDALTVEVIRPDGTHELWCAVSGNPSIFELCRRAGRDAG